MQIAGRLLRGLNRLRKKSKFQQSKMRTTLRAKAHVDFIGICGSQG
jgi:hypothetical protein